MQNRIIAGALPITAKLLADELGIKVHFGAPGFSSAVDDDGAKHLFVPDLPLDNKLADALALGGIVHEDTHFGFTDFSVMEGCSGLAKQLTNILEDVRCEALEIKKFPGARQVLNRMVAAMVANAQFSPVQKEGGLDGVKWYVLYRLRAELLGQSALQPIADSAAEVVKPLMPGASFQRLTALMFEVLQCRTTGDCADLATQIIAMLEAEAENPTPPESNDQYPQQKPDDQDQSQSQGDSQGDSQGLGSDQTVLNEDGQSGQSSAASDGQPAQQDGIGTEASQSQAASGTTNDDQGKAEAMKQFLASGGEGGQMDIGGMIAEGLKGIQKKESTVRLPDAYPMDRELGNGTDVLARLRAETNAVRRKTQGLLEAEARSRLMFGRSGTRMDTKRLWRVRTGDTRLFEKRIEGQKQDTAIQLLIDRSGSMKHRIGIASDAALAVALAMDGVQGITTSVAAFPYTSKGNSDDVLVLSQFGESFRKIASRFPAVGVQGGTPMAEAMLWGGYNLHATRNVRKILFVVTDGEPDDLDGAKQVIGTLGKSGVEVMGLGINTVVGHLFKTAGMIGDLNDLAPAIFGMLQEALAEAA